MEKEWINRGFLYGPLIPIYGYGAVVGLLLTFPVRGSIPMIFLIGMLGATVLEYCTGVVMQKLFHARYWDYSRNRFNLNGYICPFCSFAWGLFSVVQIKILHPLFESAILEVPADVSSLISTILVAIYAADTALSVQSALNLKKKRQNNQINVLQKRTEDRLVRFQSKRLQTIKVISLPGLTITRAVARIAGKCGS